MAAAATAILAAVACDLSLFGPEPPPDARRLSPPPSYRVWYGEMERCTGARGDFDDIRFHVVPGGPWRSEDGGLVVGQLYPPDDLYLADVVIERRDAVTHEFLHHILQSGHDHPSPPWGGVCAPTTVGPRPRG